MKKLEGAPEEFEALGSYLEERHEAILQEWRTVVKGDPNIPSAAQLSREKFDDHIPEILEDYIEQLVATTGEEERQGRARSRRDSDAHGLTRWQQGYELHQLTREWGHLQIVLLTVLEAYARDRVGLPPAVMVRSREILARLCMNGISGSADRYWHLHRAEAAGQVRDLEEALRRLTSVHERRLATWRGAAHDLRGGFGAVELSTELLDELGSPGELQENVELLKKNISSLREMLNELLDLARLEAGQEDLDIVWLDAAEVLQSFCSSLRPLADARKLYLRVSGPDSLRVHGDRLRIVRIVQNLVINALKYTDQGGVTVAWSDDPANGQWCVAITDTGPGFTQRSDQELRNVIEEATSLTHESPPPERAASPPPLHVPSRGEGIGLSIVKRLCELLDAVVELETKAGKGSTFRILFPRAYPGKVDR